MYRNLNSGKVCSSQILFTPNPKILPMINLSGYVRMWYAPTYLYGKRSLRTISEYVTSVEYFLNLVGDPSLDEIDPPMNARFIHGLQAMGLSVETIRKHCRNLNAVWSKAGPSGHRNRDTLRLVNEAPWIRPPEAYRRLPREIPDSEADSLYHATEECAACFKFPTYLEERRLRPVWWRALIALVASTAIRRKVVFNLTWGDFDIGHKYFVVPAEFDKCKTARRKPIHPDVLRLLDAVKCGDKILPWKHGNGKFYECWNDLNETAGIMPHLKLHDLKRYSLQLACRSGADAATLQLLGDHSSFQTTTAYYVGGNLDKYVSTCRLPGTEGGAQ